ncbi:ENR1 protein, partial [Cisticola juncidis]|nr:ENR1 protein [Cisticola juncidis]
HEGYNLYQCASQGRNPFWGVREISRYWVSPLYTHTSLWEAPSYLFWICGNRAYTRLPGDWAGSCTIGIIKPAFFMLPKNFENELGVPL